MGKGRAGEESISSCCPIPSVWQKTLFIRQDGCRSSWQFLHLFILNKTVNFTFVTSHLYLCFVKISPLSGLNEAKKQLD